MCRKLNRTYCLFVKSNYVNATFETNFTIRINFIIDAIRAQQLTCDAIMVF